MNLKHAYIVNNDNRVNRDYYPTPPIATIALLKNFELPNSVWEPCAGKGHISKELMLHGHDVYSTDLYSYEGAFVDIDSGKNFLTCKLPDVEAIVTNPPFKSNMPELFLRRVLEDGRYDVVAIFSRLTFMESARRHRLFTDNLPAKILVFSERVNCHEDFLDRNNGLGGMVAYAWFIWKKVLLLQKLTG